MKTKWSIYIIICVCFFSCTNQEEKSASKPLIFTEVNEYLFETKIIIIDIENQKQSIELEKPVAPLYFHEESEPDSINLLEYIKNNNIDGHEKYQRLSLIYYIPKELNIDRLNKILHYTPLFVKQNYSTFNGTLFIEIYFSSKNNDWMNIPPPPPGM